MLGAVIYPVLLGAAAQSAGMWHYQFNQGIGEYSTGTWDSPTGGALAISCGSDGSISIGVQIKGQAPPPDERVRFTVALRSAPRSFSLFVDATGRIAVASRADAAFRGLWADLRRGDIVTIRYGDGRTSVQSLAGAARTLPAEPCG